MIRPGMRRIILRIILRMPDRVFLLLTFLFGFALQWTIVILIRFMLATLASL